MNYVKSIRLQQQWNIEMLNTKFANVAKHWQKMSKSLYDEEVMKNGEIRTNKESICE